MPEPLTSTLIGIWVFIKTSISAIVAGILGAAVSLKFAPQMTTWEKITTVSAGAILAHFTTAPISTYFALTQYGETIGFLIGLFGLSFCAAVLKLLKDINLSGILTDVLGRKLG